jgi:hypothetical protein
VSLGLHTSDQCHQSENSSQKRPVNLVVEEKAVDKTKQDLGGLGVGDIWINGEENNRNVWKEEAKGAWILRDRIWKPV